MVRIGVVVGQLLVCVMWLGVVLGWDVRVIVALGVTALSAMVAELFFT